jgi:hypothetical protein
MSGLCAPLSFPVQGLNRVCSGLDRSREGNPCANKGKCEVPKETWHSRGRRFDSAWLHQF